MLAFNQMHFCQNCQVLYVVELRMCGNVRKKQKKQPDVLLTVLSNLLFAMSFVSNDPAVIGRITRNRFLFLP